MSILIGIISGIATVIILLLVIALFVKKEYAIQREIVIKQPVQQVFDYIKYVKNQDNYSVWNQLDPAMKKTYTGTDGKVGFIYAWDSNNKKAGKGEQEIISIREGDRLDMSLHFIKPFEGLCTAHMITTAEAASQTKVKWGIHGAMKYPMNIMMLFMNMDKLMGKDLADGLTNLKGILEK